MVVAVIAHTLRADSPDVWVTTQIQRWQGVDGLLRVVGWFGYAPQAVLIVGAGLVAQAGAPEGRAPRAQGVE